MDVINSIGRRKAAVARVFMSEGAVHRKTTAEQAQRG